jgi:hypothetical protein
MSGARSMILLIIVSTASIWAGDIAYANCTATTGSVVLQIETNFRFDKPTYDTEKFHRSLYLRIESYLDSKDADYRPIYSADNQLTFRSDNNSSDSKFCIELPTSGRLITATDLLRAPVRFKFGYGPKTIEIAFPELLEKYSELAGLGDDTLMGAGHVVHTSDRLSIIDKDGPTWLAALETQLDHLIDGTVVLRVKLHNTATTEVRDVSLSLSASNANIRCQSLPTLTEATIAIRKAEESYETAATDLIFGDLVMQPAKIQHGPCGEVDINVDLGDLPPIAPSEDFYINYRLNTDGVPTDDVFRDFWTNMPYRWISFSGSNVWPKSLGVE